MSEILSEWRNKDGQQRTVADALEAEFFAFLAKLKEAELSPELLKALFVTFNQGLHDHERNLIPGIYPHSVQIHTLARGTAAAAFEREFGRVMDNIGDEATDAKKERKITLTIAIKPNSDRNVADVKVAAKSSLAPQEETRSILLLDVTAEGVNARERSSVSEQKSLL